MNEKYMTYGDVFRNNDGLEFDTKYLMDLLGVAMKESGSNKEPHQVTLEPEPKVKPNNNKYKYLLIGC
jgi:hypothetical protein